MDEQIQSVITAEAGWVAEYEGPGKESVPIVCWALIEEFLTKQRRVVGLVDGRRSGRTGIIPVEPDAAFLGYRRHSPDLPKR